MKNKDADLELYKNHKYPERKWKDKQCDKYISYAALQWLSLLHNLIQ